MNRFALLALATAIVSTPALSQDARLASRDYKSDEVVRIDGRAGVQASIAFARDEHIENVAIGDSSSWQVTPNKRADILFVKPLDRHARTNMTVVTDKRSYFFELVASTTARPLYQLRFNYPEDAKRAASQAAQHSNGMATLAPGGGEPDPATLNFAWDGKGKRNLLPSRIYDDGVSTYISWPAGAPIPAFLVRNEKGEEGPVNFAVRGDVIVIDGVPRLIVLRSGKDSATIEYKGQPRPQQESVRALAAASTTAASKEQ